MKKYRSHLLLTVSAVCPLLVFPLAEAASSAPPPFSQLEKQVSKRFAVNSDQKIKKAVLELAVERARQAHDRGLRDEAEALATEVTLALTAPAKNFARRNPDAAHLGILKPLLAERNNPYLIAMVKEAGETLSKPDAEWPRAVADKPTFAAATSSSSNPHNVRSAARSMRESFWLFAHSQSPMRGDAELLKRALRRAHAYIDGLTLDRPGLENRPDLYDQFAVEESFYGLYEIIELHPSLLLPSQRKAWDQALKKATTEIWKRMLNARAWNLNIETARMVGVLNMGYYTENEEMLAKVISHVDAVLKRMRPDGGWPYHGEGNPSVNYHNALLGSLLRIYEQTGYKPIAEALAASQWKGPVMGRTDEFWTSPFFKTSRWNFETGTEAGPEAVAALSGNPYLRSLLDRDIKPDRNQVAWYRSDIKPRPLPTHYTIPDRNVMGPRGWYGEFCYAGTFHDPQKVAGHETLMGAMTVDRKDGRLNSILTDVTPRIWAHPTDKVDPKTGKVVMSAWGKLTDDLIGATTITRHYSVATALHGIACVRLGAYQGEPTTWQGRQIWIGMPDRIIGLVSVVPDKNGAEAYAINGVLRLISGGAAGAAVTKILERITDARYRYGELEILVHHTTYASLTPIEKKYRRDNYPATELTFSNRKREPSPPGELTHFPADTDFRFVVEIRPATTTTPLDVKALGDQQLIGIQVRNGPTGLQVWLNASTKDRDCTMQKDQLPGAKTSYTLSDGVLGRSTFSSELPPQATLRPGQHAVLVVSPNPLDHRPGWESFTDMVQK